MAIIDKFTNPFSSLITGTPKVPSQAVPQVAPQPFSSGMLGAANPFQQASFAGLKGRTDTGLSLLRPERGQAGLNDKAIKTPDGRELGRNLFINI